MTHTTCGEVEAVEVLAQVVRLLCRCTDAAFAQAQDHPMGDLSALGLAAQLLADQAMALLPPGVDLDHPAPKDTDPRLLLLAAETLTRSMPIETFPAGTSQLITGLCDLIREHPA